MTDSDKSEEDGNDNRNGNDPHSDSWRPGDGGGGGVDMKERKTMEENGQKDENAVSKDKTRNGAKEEEEEKEKEKDDGKWEEDDSTGIPVDTGYSWIICISVCFLQMLVFGHNRALSTWFVDIREEFQQPQTVTSLALSVFALSLAVSSLVSSNVIMKLFPPRVACVCASLGSSTAVFVASQSPHIGLWLACYVLRGLSCGVLIIIPMSLIGYYFKSRRGLASSIASMGLVVANIIFPPMASALIQTFGLRGAMLLVAGVELHMIPLSMLLRSHTSYLKRHKRRQILSIKSALQGRNTDNALDNQHQHTQENDKNQHHNNNNHDQHHQHQHQNQQQNNLSHSQNYPGSKITTTPTTVITNNINNNYNKNNNNNVQYHHQQQQQHEERDVNEAAAIELYFYSSSAPPIANAHLDLDEVNQPPNIDLDKGQEYDVSTDHQSQIKTTLNENTQDIEESQGGGNSTSIKTDTELLHEQRKPLLDQLPPARMLSVNETSGSKTNNNSKNGPTTAANENDTTGTFDSHYRGKGTGEDFAFLSSPKSLRKRYRLKPEHSRTSHHSSQMSIAALGSSVDVSCIMLDEGKMEKGGGGGGARVAAVVVDDDDDEDGDDDDEGDEECNKKPTFRQVCQPSSFFDTSLFKSWRFRMLAVFMPTSAGAIFLTVYLPVLATEAGLTRGQGSILLTIGGSVDLVVRPLIGWLGDKNVVSKEKMMAISLAIVSILAQFGRYYTTFPLFVMFTCLSCLFAGFRANLYHAIALEYFGPRRAPNVFALTLVFTTVFMAANHPIFGALLDTTGSHVIPLHYVGGIVSIATLVMMLQPLFARLDRQKEEKEKEERRIKREIDR